MGEKIDLGQHCEPVKVEVVNQLDLSTIEALLTQIRDSTAAIDANTDEVETKLDSVILELQNNGTTNHNDLLAVIAELQSIDANTDQLETQLASIISNTSTNATEATLQALLTAFNLEDFATEAKQDVQIANQGTEGATPPAIAGTGIIGYLRAIFDRLAQTFAFNGDRLKVDAAVTLDGESTFGDNSTKTTVALSDVSATVLAANLDRKEVFVVNSTNKTIWVCYGSPAVYGNGIPLFKNDILIEDRYRGIITAIMNTGDSGNIEVTEVTL